MQENEFHMKMSKDQVLRANPIQYTRLKKENEQDNIPSDNFFKCWKDMLTEQAKRVMFYYIQS